MSKNRFRGLTVPAALALSAVIAFGGVPAASAQSSQDAQVAQFSSQFQDQLNGFAGNAREQAWNTRNGFLAQMQHIDPQAARALQPAVDGIVNAAFPGLIAQKEAEAQAARDAAARAQAEQAAREQAAAEAAARQAEAERQRNQFDHGPCPADAAVCVDINGRRTWLQQGGNVTYIAPSMAPGKPGQETPRGTFYVTRKVKDEVSHEFNDAPMPYAVYFTNSGHAFHMGNPAYDSAGCVRLPEQAAIRYFNDLQIGQKVFIY